MLRKIFREERIPDALLAETEDATHLDRKDLIQIIRRQLKDDPDNHNDMYSIFLQARAAGHFLENETVARLKCLVALDREVSEKALSTTTPGGSILHALQRFMSDGTTSQHAGKQAILQFVAEGLFSGATISELLQEPIKLPQEPNQDSSREYRQVINSLVCDMHRLCLPSNIESGNGSSPVFSDNEPQEKFWRRTGYRLHDYKANYDKLKALPASDPRPKRDRKRFQADFVDGKDPAIVAWEKRHPGILDEDYPEAMGGYDSTSRGLVSLAAMKYLIRIYFDSNPGFHTQEHRVLLPSIRAFFGKSLSHERKLFLRQKLVYRLQANQQANQHCKLLGLYRMPAMEKWTPGQTSSSYDYATFSKFAEKIAHSGLYHWKPSSGQGVVYYRKPS